VQESCEGEPLLCPGCRTGRIIPLSFAIDQSNAAPEVIVRRPMAKCCTCGERIYARMVVRSSLPIELDFDVEEGMEIWPEE
jgi:hypothetical protein